MAFKLFAMDTFFTNSLGCYEFDARCEMLAELGYDGTYLTLFNDTDWGNLSKLTTVKERYGLEVAGVYAGFDIAGDESHEGNRRILDMVETLEGCASVELSMISSDASLKPSDPQGDKRAVSWLQKLLRVAERRNISISLYHHMFFWMERIEDAVRLCRRLDHPCLGMVFCGYHWFVVDGRNLRQRLEEAAPFLRSANLCGCTMLDAPVGGLPASVQLLHEGALDNFAMLAMLKKVGYDGMIGLQGYSVGGDAYNKLERSIDAFRSMVRRIEEHPEWATLRPA